MNDCEENNVDSLIKLLDAQSNPNQKNEPDDGDSINDTSACSEKVSHCKNTKSKEALCEGTNKYPRSKKYNDYGYDIHQKLKEITSNNNNAVEEKPMANLATWKTNKSALHVSPVIRSPSEKHDVYADPIFGLRIINPVVSSQLLQSKMTGRQPIHLHKISYHLKNGDKSVDWVFAGVIVFKSGLKTSQKGSQYCIYKISDLRCDMKSVSLFLFGKACNELWKMSVGTVIAVLNATPLQNKEENTRSSDDITVTVRFHDQVMIWGTSKDYGICKAKKKNGENCTSFVNKTECEYCIYHIKNEYNKFTGKRSELQSPSFQNHNSLRNKILGKNEVFYGGKSFTAVKTSTQSRKLMDKDKKILNGLSSNSGSFLNVENGNMKLAKIDKSTLDKLAVKQDDYKLLLEKKMADGADSIKLKKSATGNESCSRLQMIKEAGEQMKITGQPVRISAAEPVARKSFVKFSEIFSENKDKEQEANGDIFSFSKSIKIEPAKTSRLPGKNKNILQTNINIDNGKNSKQISTRLKDVAKNQFTKNDLSKSKMKSDSIPVKNCEKIADIANNREEDKKTIATDVFGSNRRLFPNLTPVSKCLTARRSQLARAKNEAVQLIRNKGGIEKSNPNRIRPNNDSKKRKASGSDHKDEVNHDNKNVLSKRFVELMNATSEHENLVTLAEDMEQQAYFNKMEQKEKLEEKMLTTFRVPCKAVKCIKCKYTWFSASDLCKLENHPLKVIDTTKRFFKCSGCGNRTVSLEVIPLLACNQCGESRWSRAPMIREKRASIEHHLSIRGDEVKFLNSCQSSGNLNLSVPE